MWTAGGGTVLGTPVNCANICNPNDCRSVVNTGTDVDAGGLTITDAGVSITPGEAGNGRHGTLHGAVVQHRELRWRSEDDHLWHRLRSGRKEPRSTTRSSTSPSMPRRHCRASFAQEPHRRRRQLRRHSQDGHRDRRRRSVRMSPAQSGRRRERDSIPEHLGGAHSLLQVQRHRSRPGHGSGRNDADQRPDDAEGVRRRALTVRRLREQCAQRRCRDRAAFVGFEKSSATGEWETSSGLEFTQVRVAFEGGGHASDPVLSGDKRSFFF
jgi:hypothetical protein